MNRLLRRLGGAAALLTLAVVASCDEDTVVGPQEQYAVRVTAQSARPTFATLGRTMQVTAEVTDANGQPVSRTVHWATSDPSIVGVSQTGVITAVGNGVAGITASLDRSVSEPLFVTVRQVPLTLSLSSATAVVGVGDWMVLAATARDSAQNLIAGARAPRLQWMAGSDSTPVVMLRFVDDATALVLTVAPGGAEISVSLGTRTAAMQVIVTSPGAQVSYNADVQPVLDANCVSCHTGAAGVFDMRAGASYNNLVGYLEPVEGMARVTPGDVWSSTVVSRLTPWPGCPYADEQMPANGSVGTQQIRIIKDWIYQGAPNN